MNDFVGMDANESSRDGFTRSHKLDLRRRLANEKMEHTE
jgi:hypothetical protein